MDNTDASMTAMGRTTDYEFTFVVSGATVDDEHIVETLDEQFDAMLFRGGGQDLLTVASTGVDAVTAAIEIVHAIAGAVPGLRFERIDRGLVGVPEIAQRTERTRQNVTQWVSGERQGSHGPFPAPEGTAGRARVWLWSEVNQWLKPLGLDDGFTYPTRAEMAAIDHFLMSGHRMLHIPLVSELPTDEWAGRRAEIRDQAVEAFSLELLLHLAGSATTKDESGRHVVVVAAPEEPAALVMERMAQPGHDVVLITRTDRIVATVMSTSIGSRPTKLVNVPLDATMRDWMDLMAANPGCAFALSSAGSTKAAPRTAQPGATVAA